MVIENSKGKKKQEWPKPFLSVYMSLVSSVVRP